MIADTGDVGGVPVPEEVCDACGIVTATRLVIRESGRHNCSRYLRSYSKWMASDERGSDAISRGRDAVTRAVRALRDVVAAIDAGEVPDSGVLRNHLVGVVVTLDMLTAEQNQEPAQ